MKTNIFKIAAYICLPVLILTLNSCSDFLEESPYDFAALEDLEDSEESVEYIVAGVYSKWCDRILRYNNFPYSIDLDSDYISGASWFFGSLGAGNFSDAGNVECLWEDLYSLADRCNSAISQLEEMENIDEDVLANAIGEMYFNKAIAYFILTRAFGAIPISDVPAKDLLEEGLSLYGARVEIKDVYAEIISLLERAEESLYCINDANYSVGHASKGSAAGLLAKVYATMGAASTGDGTITIQSGQAYDGERTNLLPAHDVVLDVGVVDGYEEFDATECYEKVIEYCAKLEAGEYGDYDLLDYESLWQRSSYNLTSGAEHMFSLYGVDNDTVYGNKLHTYYSYTAYSDGMICQGLYIGFRYHWYNLFESDDKRINDGILHRWQTTNATNGTYYPTTGYYKELAAAGEYPYNDGLTYTAASGEKNLAFVTKYFNVSDITSLQSDASYPMLRYADILLLYAEALNEITPGSQDAKDLVERVRVRSLESADMTDLNDATTRNALRSVIIEERAKEFAGEANRRWDLIRWGIYLGAMNAIEGSDECSVAKSRQEKHLLYPIPLTEILANENINENNPGWN